MARIFLNRPQKVNALDSALLRELLSQVEELGKDPALRVLVLGGHGKAFCGGADVNELRSLDAGTAGAFVEKIHRVCTAIRAAPFPVVAQLHGAVIGSGRAAWLVLTGETIDTRRAYEWSLVEEIGGEDAVERLAQRLLQNDSRALKIQKGLLQLWEEAPLAEAIRQSIDRFAEAYANRGQSPNP